VSTRFTAFTAAADPAGLFRFITDLVALFAGDLRMVLLAASRSGIQTTRIG
jgi:hypothetical protein